MAHEISKKTTDVVTKKVENATSENFNAAENAASTNNLNLTEMEVKNSEVVSTTKIAIIDGEEREILVAHTDYSMEQPKDAKDLIGSIDRTKLLPCTFYFAKPELFWDAGIDLKDENGNLVEKGADNVLVLCPTADTYWRVSLEEKIKAEIREFASVQDYAQTIGCTNLYSRGLSNTEKVGVAALATGNEACKTVFMFAKKHKMNITTAKLYLDCTMKPTTILEMTMGTMPEKMLTLGRKEKDAEKLLDAATKKFNKNAEKRYAIRAINTLLRKEEYSLKDMLSAIKKVTDGEILSFELATSEDKQNEITITLTQHLKDLKKDVEQKEAA